MKILQVNKLYHPWIGGVEKIVQQIAEGLNKKDNLEIEVLCVQPKGKRKIEEVKGVKVWRAKSFGIFWGMPISFDFFRLFKKLIKSVDVVDFHHPFPLGDLAILLSKPKKIVVHYHSDIVRQKILIPFLRPLLLSTLRKADVILVSNPNLINSSPYLKRFKNKCRVVPFGVDFNELEECLDEQEIRKNKEKYGDFIFFMGRLNYYKGVNYLIEAIRDININLVIVGEGQEQENLKTQVGKLGIEDKVFFLPFQDRKASVNLFKTAKLFVLPSIFRSEAFGIVLIEAMACATPLVSTELGTGTSWVNQDGQTGFVVPPRDSDALKTAIKKLIENKELAQKMSQASEYRAIEKFDLKTMLTEIENIYQTI